MKITEIVVESISSKYPDTEQGAKSCFVAISTYKPKDITKVYPDPHVSGVWAIHTNTKDHGHQKHVLWLDKEDFATDDRSGNDEFSITESTTAGSIATVSQPMNGKPMSRYNVGKGIYNSTNIGNLLTGKKTNKKYANSIGEESYTESVKRKLVSEGKMKELAMDLDVLDNGNFVKKYKKTKQEMRRKLQGQGSDSDKEVKLDESDYIVDPSVGHKIGSGFIPKSSENVEETLADIVDLIKDIKQTPKNSPRASRKLSQVKNLLNSIKSDVTSTQIDELLGGVIAGGMTTEDAKVDRMVKHIQNSELKSGKSKKESENIAWATVNKRGYLNRK